MKRSLIWIALLALLVAPQFVLGSDLDDLKAINEKSIKAWSDFDAETLSETVYPGFVLFDRDSAFAEIITVESSAQGLKEYFATLESLSITPINYQYKVVGNTGIVWGYEAVTYKAKDGPVRSIQSRVTSTWIKSGGKWLILSSHSSAIPSGE